MARKWNSEPPSRPQKHLSILYIGKCTKNTVHWKMYLKYSTLFAITNKNHAFTSLGHVSAISLLAMYTLSANQSDPQ